MTARSVRHVSTDPSSVHDDPSRVTVRGLTGVAAATGGVLDAGTSRRDVDGGGVGVLALGRLRVRDTGVTPSAEDLLRWYLDESTSFARRLLGRFAIVVLDDRTGQTHLIRDQLGIVPVYFTVVDGVLTAGLDVAPLVEQSRFSRSFGPDNLVDLLNTTSRVPGTTVLRDLYEVAPAHVATFAAGEVTQRRYWSPPTQVDSSVSLDDAVAAVRESVEASTREALQDIPRPTAHLLSGGLDSSVLTAVAAGVSESALQTYSFRYALPDNVSGHTDALHRTSDSPFAREVSEFLGTDHQEFVFDAGVDHIGLLDHAVTARGIPGPGDLDNGLTRLLDRLDGVGARSYLGGEGADDIFGGFPWSDPSVGSVRSFPWLLDTSAGELLHESLRRDWNYDDELGKRWRDAVGEHGGDPDGAHDSDSPVVVAVGISRFLPFLVDRAERLSRARGIHPVLPFLDPRIVETAASLPSRIRRAGDIEKGVLREAFRGALPDSVIARRKSGFAIDVDPQYTRAVRDYLRGRVQAADSVLIDIVDVDRLRALLDSDSWNDGRFAAPPLLPRLVQLDLWARRFDLRFVQHEVAR